MRTTFGLWKWRALFRCASIMQCVIIGLGTISAQVTFTVINNGTGTNNAYQDISWQAGPINAPNWNTVYTFSATPIPPGGSESTTIAWSGLPGAGGGSGWQPYYFAIYNAALGTQAQQQSWDTFAGQSSPVTYIFFMYGTNVPTCTTNLTWNIQNGSSSYQTYIAANYPLLTPAQANAGVPEPGGDTSGLLSLNPGQSGLLTVPDVQCTNASAWQVYLVQSFEAANSGSNGSAVTYPLGVPAPGIGAPSGSPGSASPTSSAPLQTTPQQLNLPNGTGQYNATNASVSGTNAPILYSSSSTTNTIISQQQGDQALYTAIVNASQQAHQDALGIIGTNVLVGAQLASFITNIPGAIFSNGVLESLSISNNFTALRNWLATNTLNVSLGSNGQSLSLSNYATQTTLSNMYAMMQAYQNFTNQQAQYQFLMTNGLVLDAGTATNNGDAALSGLMGNLDSAQASLAGVYNGAGLDGSGSPVDAVISMGGTYEFEIQPNNSTFSPLWALLKTVESWLLVIFYAIKIINDIQDAIFKMMASRGQGVPDLELSALGFGGNFLGVGLFPLFVTAVMVIWAGCCFAIFAGLGTVLSFDTLTSLVGSNPLAAMDSGALYMLLACWPAALFFELIAAYLLWRVTVIKAVVVVFAAIRFIPH